MEHDDPAEALTELRERRLGALELLQAAAGSGLAAYAVWALLLQPGFRRVPLRLQVRARLGRAAEPQLGGTAAGGREYGGAGPRVVRSLTGGRNRVKSGAAKRWD